MLQTLRDEICQPRLLFPAKISVTTDGENKIFHDKAKVKQYLSASPFLQTMLEKIFQPKEVNYDHENTGNN